jgi:hypothetical protein
MCQLDDILISKQIQNRKRQEGRIHEKKRGNLICVNGTLRLNEIQRNDNKKSTAYIRGY